MKLLFYAIMSLFLLLSAQRPVIAADAVDLVGVSAGTRDSDAADASTNSVSETGGGRGGAFYDLPVAAAGKLPVKSSVDLNPYQEEKGPGFVPVMINGKIMYRKVEGYYLVRVDGKLWIAALVKLNDPYKWRDIYQANRKTISNPNIARSLPSLENMPDVGDVPIGRLALAGNNDYSLNPFENDYKDDDAYQPGTPLSSYGVKPRRVRRRSGPRRRRRSGGLDLSTKDWSESNLKSWGGYTPPDDIKPYIGRFQQSVSNGEFGGKLNASMPISMGRITSNFGMRNFKGKWEHHNGIDIAAPTGTAIKATGDGVVIFTGRSGGYGNLVKVLHPDGSVTFYAHCKDFQVRKGDRVRAGQQIARVNNTGRSTGPHLHFGLLKEGRWHDPRKYWRFPAKGSSL